MNASLGLIAAWLDLWRQDPAIDLTADSALLAAALIHCHLSDPTGAAVETGIDLQAIDPDQVWQARSDFAASADDCQTVGSAADSSSAWHYSGIRGFCRGRAERMLTGVTPDDGVDTDQVMQLNRRLQYFLDLDDDEFAACFTRWGTVTNRYLDVCRLADEKRQSLLEAPSKKSSQRRRDNRRAIG